MDDHSELNLENNSSKVFLIRDVIEFIRNNHILNWKSVTSVNGRRAIFDFIHQISDGCKWDDKYTSLLNKKIVNFSLVLSRKLLKSNRKVSTFYKINNEWLNTTFQMPKSKVQTLKPNTDTVGRPPTTFSESSERTKRRKMYNLIKSSNMTSPEIIYASNSIMQKSGQRSVARFFKNATSSANSSLKIKNAIKKSKSTEIVPYNADEALAFFIENDLTKQQYTSIRLSAKNRNADIYPPYSSIIEAKKLCYPENCVISETRCEIKLQNLLNHTSLRIFQIPTVDTHDINNMHNFEILYKWGCDGSNGQSSYKQMYENDNVCMDSDLFMFSIVPLQLRCSNEKNEIFVLWKNNRTSSTRYCRPIMFDFKKETVASTLLEVNVIEDQINQLNASIIPVNGIEIAVTHKLVFTMVDGKVCNSLTNTSSQKCYICGSTPTKMNDIEKYSKFEVKEESLKFGLSTLHAWIRFFECLLHISYRLEFKSWSVRTPEHKLQLSETKKHIQERFRKEMGLLVDIVVQGKGSTNDGNTARRFFQNPEKSCEITGIDINLFKRFANILSVISSGYEVNIEAFETYALDTAKLYIHLYPWYYMPASIHKVLVHGAEIIRYAILPIGQLSEEAQESRNKDYKRIREHHTRKSSRKNTNEDLFHMLLVSSDPYISSIRKLPTKCHQELSDEAKLLCVMYNENDDLNKSFNDMDLNT